MYINRLLLLPLRYRKMIGNPLLPHSIMSEDNSGRRSIQESIIEPKKLDDEKIDIGTIDDIEKKINKEGKIALEGIYFYFVKAIIKPESHATLNTISFILSDTLTT